MKPTENQAPAASFWRVMGLMLRQAQRTHPTVFLAYILTSAAFTALLVAELHYIRILLDRLPLFVAGTVSYRNLVWTILTLGVIGVSWTVMNAGMNITYEYLARLTTARMTEAMGEKASRLALIRFESAELYDGIEKAHAGRGRGFDAMEALLCSLIFHGGYFLFLALYLIQFEPWLVLGVFGAFLPVAIARKLRASALYRTENKVAPLRRQFNHYEACLTDRTYFKETRTTGAVPFFRWIYDRTLEAYNQEMWRTELRAGLLDLALKVLTLGGYIGLLAMLVRFVVVGRISAGLFGAVYFAMDSIFKWFDELFDRLGYAYENAAFGANYLAFLESPERESGDQLLPRDRGIELRDVSFRYPYTSENAVESVSLTIQPGESVAIVGENGAGKSTLVRLIAGLYQPDSGTVFAGGVDLRDAEHDTRFQRLSAVFQSYQRYRMTLLDNVRLAEPPGSTGHNPNHGEHDRAAAAAHPHTSNPDSPGEDERQSERDCAAQDEYTRVSSALHQAGFYQRYAGDRPIDLDTMLAREFGGVDLSGGEWQRVAIARGLYRPHDTIILDEPTAAIDPLEENRIYRMFLESARGKTAIIVTHRLGLARIAGSPGSGEPGQQPGEPGMQPGRILVMQHGRLVQDGTHADLMAADGPYAHMFRAQAAWYQREVEESVPSSDN